MFTVDLRFYEELNDFLPRERRKTTFSVTFGGRRSVKDLIESQGIPHTEVDLVLANGEPTGFDYCVRHGDRISVYPAFESIDIRSVSRLGRHPLRECRFVADVHLGKLVRWLRLLGLDCVHDRAWDDPELAEISAQQKRILLTRDRGLLKRAIVTHGIYLHSDQPDEQVREVLRRLDLTASIRPFSRCTRCNGTLNRVRKSEVADRVPERTRRQVDEYFRCSECGKVYWRGSHWPRLQRLVQRATSGRGGDALCVTRPTADAKRPSHSPGRDGCAPAQRSR